MSIYNELEERSGKKCELCSSENDIKEFAVSPRQDDNAANMIVLCSTCNAQVSGEEDMDVNHWRCLNESMWSTIPAVQVVSFRMLNRLENESWAQDLVPMMYMEDETREWAEQGISSGDAVIHKDSNGNILVAGDTVTLIKDLVVKGANFTAKRGTAVRRISLVHDNPNHIEGKVEGQHIVILTQYVKKN